MIETPGWQNATVRAAVMSRDVFLPILSLSALIRCAWAESLTPRWDSKESRRKTAPCQGQERVWAEQSSRKKQIDIWSVKLNALFINLKEEGVDQEGFLMILNCPSCTRRPLEGYLGPFLVTVYDKRMDCNNWRQNLIFPDQGLNQTAFNLYAFLSTEGCAGSVQVSKAFGWPGAGSILAGEIL